MITSCGDSVQWKWTFIKKCCYWRAAVFAFSVATRFVFSESCLNSSFPASTGIRQRQQRVHAHMHTKSEISKLKGIIVLGRWAFSVRLLTLTIRGCHSLDKSLCGADCVCVCGFVWACFVLGSPSSVWRSLTDAYYNLSADNVTLKSCFWPSSFIFHRIQTPFFFFFALYLHYHCARVSRWCLTDVHVWRWYRVSLRWKGRYGPRNSNRRQMGSASSWEVRQ